MKVEEVRSIVEAAVRAPSVHNTQPWKFVSHREPDSLDVFGDRERLLGSSIPMVVSFISVVGPPSSSPASAPGVSVAPARSTCFPIRPTPTTSLGSSSVTQCLPPPKMSPSKAP